MQGKILSILEALSYHSWTNVIRGTAAAIAVHSAEAVFANVMMNEVIELDSLNEFLRY